MKCLNCANLAHPYQPFCSLECASERYTIITAHQESLETLLNEAMQSIGQLLALL